MPYLCELWASAIDSELVRFFGYFAQKIALMKLNSPLFGIPIRQIYGIFRNIAVSRGPSVVRNIWFLSQKYSAPVTPLISITIFHLLGNQIIVIMWFEIFWFFGRIIMKIKKKLHNINFCILPIHHLNLPIAFSEYVN